MRGPASPRPQAWGGDDDLETAGTLLRCWTLGKARPSDLGRKVSGAGVRVRPRRDARRTRARRGSWSWGTASGISWPLAGPGAWEWASCPAATASRSSRSGRLPRVRGPRGPAAIPGRGRGQGPQPVGRRERPREEIRGWRVAERPEKVQLVPSTDGPRRPLKYPSIAHSNGRNQ